MPEPPQLLDLSQFASVEDALDRIAPRQRYVGVAKSLDMLERSKRLRGVNVGWLFWLSMITRSEGLHEAIAREARQGNPHAVFPLIRAFADTVVMLLYVVDHPDYVDTLTVRAGELQKGGRQRKKLQALIAHVSKQAPGLKHVYAELSEATHFGSAALWMSHSVLRDGDAGARRAIWTSNPNWRDEKQALIACALTLELAEAMQTALNNFAVRHIKPLLRP
jgi:hypothetical protein